MLAWRYLSPLLNALADVSSGASSLFSFLSYSLLYENDSGDSAPAQTRVAFPSRQCDKYQNIACLLNIAHMLILYIEYSHSVGVTDIL